MPTQRAADLSSSGTRIGPLTTPSIQRRLAAFVYEGVLLFGVLFVAGWLYSTLTQLKDPGQQGTLGLQLFLLLVLGVYFVWFWSRGGQTVAMKAWHIRLVDRQDRPVSQTRALARFALAWLWFLPALMTAKLAGLQGGALFGLMFVGVLAYAGLARLHPDRQFWHDVVCGTRLVDWRPAR
jgi:uncharacterized RDD family membrane protein YckC